MTRAGEIRHRNGSTPTGSLTILISFSLSLLASLLLFSSHFSDRRLPCGTKFDRSGRSEGVAWVTYASEKHAAAAKEAFDGALAKGESLLWCEYPTGARSLTAVSTAQASRSRSTLTTGLTAPNSEAPRPQVLCSRVSADRSSEFSSLLTRFVYNRLILMCFRSLQRWQHSRSQICVFGSGRRSRHRSALLSRQVRARRRKQLGSSAGRTREP